ncbi:TetR/AcrR family transcriptional regulator [Spirillospora albida]|uniref:TetR/AcrR family transcriptional regulator n=1 Tax=Spirillospora albida TaxID=58123 RepID=UPI0004C02EC7|nr:TetR/AcrR family transcriptional regulator [Spirillospora albida]
MGNREDLLNGALRCLYEKGYARTTLRDIAAAAGVSMAAVGYHYGSTEKLLNIALMRALEEWGAAFGGALAEGGTALWDGIIASVEAHGATATASFEAFVQSQRVPELREQIAAGQRAGRRGLAAMVTGTPEDEVSDHAARTVGSVHLALITGLIVQWLTDPEHAPSGAEVVEGLHALSAHITDDR